MPESVKDHLTKAERRTYSSVEALDVRCQDRIAYMRLFLDSSKYICMVRHLYKGANHVQCRVFTNTITLRHHISQHKLEEKWIIKNSALYSSEQRHPTCGTHFEETKLVASITGRPAPESISISWIFTPVGTISWGTMELKQLELALMGGGMQRTLFPPPVMSAFYILHAFYTIFVVRAISGTTGVLTKRWWSGDRKSKSKWVISPALISM